MPVKIRLMRIGTKKRPFYRVVAVDERNKRTGGYLELLGTYNPLTEPKEIILKKDRIEDWLKKGAQPSEGYLRIIGKAPKRPPRKPRKEKVSKEPSPSAKATGDKEETEKSSIKEATGEVEQESQPEADRPLDEESQSDKASEEKTN